jgi:hypothetical protein
MIEILPSLDRSYATLPNIGEYQELLQEREMIKSRLSELKKQISSQSTCLEKFRSECSISFCLLNPRIIQLELRRGYSHLTIA